MKTKSVLSVIIITAFVYSLAVCAHAEIDPCDFDSDGDVDAADLAIFTEKFGTIIWYKDFDSDGYSDGNTEYSISQPIGYYLESELIAISGDCDDKEENTNSGMGEICDDHLDNDCDGQIDLDDTDCCLDEDGDGYGTGPFCIDPDCNDNNPNIPGGPCDGADLDSCMEGVWVCEDDAAFCSDTTDDNIETCNGRDDNCNGHVDEGGELCNDGLDCTTDLCEGSRGCTYPIISNRCLIEGMCYYSNETELGNRCKYCDPTWSKTSWNYRYCNDGNSCTVDSCDPISGCVYTPKVCNDGRDCTTDFCSHGICSYIENCTGSKKYDCGFFNGICFSDYRCNYETGGCYAPNCCF